MMTDIKENVTVKTMAQDGVIINYAQFHLRLIASFLSFGIANDYSFDTDLANKATCSGLALDPTIKHNSMLNDRVWFLCMGATTLEDPPAGWMVTSVPGILKFAHWESIDVLKMDCEGCEYAIARDVLAEDPELFKRVGQFAIEIHISKKWIQSMEHLLNLGKLFVLLEDAGLSLITAELTTCLDVDEAPGCHEKLLELNFPCSQHHMCQNYLFARSEIEVLN